MFFVDSNSSSPVQKMFQDIQKERIKAFNENFIELAQLNFDLLVDSIKSITLKTQVTSWKNL